MTHPRVVNVRRRDAKWDVYVGRGREPGTGKLELIPWFNPFRFEDHGKEAMRLFLNMLEGSPRLVADARRLLAGKVLGCWCAPGPCHAEALALLADGEPLDEVKRRMLALVGLPPVPQGSLFPEARS
jgi:hypothetical protein